ncbi:alpha-1A adrenergic receptor-like, partial [Paramuricea clavata]
LYKFIAMIIGVLGNITVIIYTIFLSKEKTATSYLVGNLALADLLLCLTFYPISIIELIQIISNIDSDQDLFCKLHRSTIWALLFASVATLLAITVDRYLYIVKPLKYPLIVTKRRVFLAISGIWLAACCLCTVLPVHFGRFDYALSSVCPAGTHTYLLLKIFVCYVPLTLIFILNFRIFNVARKQRKRILAEPTVNISSELSPKRQIGIVRLLVGFKAAKTFGIVVAVLTFCVLTPTVLGIAIKNSCESCYQMWYIVFQYDFYGMNSIVNAFIYGMRHIKYRKAYGNILVKLLRCNKLTN